MDLFVPILVLPLLARTERWVDKCYQAEVHRTEVVVSCYCRELIPERRILDSIKMVLKRLLAGFVLGEVSVML